jgi:hypothetical protein
MSVADDLVEHCKRVGEAYNLVNTTAKAPKPYVKEVCYDEGKLLNGVPGIIPGAFLYLSVLSVLTDPPTSPSRTSLEEPLLPLAPARL